MANKANKAKHHANQHVSKGKKLYLTPHGVYWNRHHMTYAVFTRCEGKVYRPASMGLGYGTFPTLRGATIMRNKLFKKLGIKPDDRRAR